MQPTTELAALLHAAANYREIVGIDDNDTEPVSRIDAARTALALRQLHAAAEALALADEYHLTSLRGCRPRTAPGHAG